MNWKKFFHSILYPHIAVIILFLPISITLVVCSLIYFNSDNIISVISYALAFYMLIVFCLRIPNIISFCKKIKTENKLLNKYFTDVRFRINISLYGSLIWNGVYALIQLILGFYNKSYWFYSMAIYYSMLAIMRFFILKHTRNYEVHEEQKQEFKRYIICGYLLLIMNLSLGGVVTMIFYRNMTSSHSQIIAITMAAYTFFTFIFAIINLVKYRKYHSPMYSAAKIITLVAASVSIVTLESTMLSTFGAESDPEFIKIMLACTGFVICLFTISVALFMIIKGTKDLHRFEKGELNIKDLDDTNNNIEYKEDICELPK